MAELYTYAVARIHAKELSLLNSRDVEQLVTAKDKPEVLRILADKGFGNGSETDTEALLDGEFRKTRELIGELLNDTSVLDVFLLEKDFHNLKAAVKVVYTESPADGIFMDGGSISAEKIHSAVSERNFEELPMKMRYAAEEAAAVLNRTGDGQLCDIIVDRAALEAIREAGEKSGSEMLDGYSELFVALADIKIAFRCARLGKSAEFTKKAVAKCASLDSDKLIRSAAAGTEELIKYIEITDYASCVPFMKESDSMFEKHCDNLIMDFIKKQKTNPFTIGPVAAYVLARENEIKTVRIILSAKENGLPEAGVRERLRDMYV